MSSGPVGRVLRQDIQLVQNLIERCLQLYMNQTEVVGALLEQAKIEPGFTELVWQKLEEENREFFKAYYLRLMVKHQIMEFNKFLEEQVELMRQLHPTGVASVQTTNGSHIQSVNQKQVCYAPDHADQSLKSENAQHPRASCLSNTFLNEGGSSMNTNVPPSPSVEMSNHARRSDAPPNMLSSHVMNMPLMQGMNGGMIKPEAGFSTCGQYMYGGDRNTTLEAHSRVGDASVAPFSNEPNTQTLNDPLLDSDTSTFGFLGQIPRNFSLSDLTADFPQSSDILESYDRSTFLPGECQGDNKRLETISEGFSYENLGSD
ncbi:PREDICTED: uncharacterized protein LOC104816410 [Tarenaya hassleriana]|uniref:uncharacterized protein LOC104816410 n=1 Tax=Tarenaya hassleriana TaxID=28532 RepID=UPI00053C76D1|nr:PREDICTED: uncharacterized protein LOC104816410 [Tarenaya hassleriana]XP_010543525.1 PREDICTED: uncharacterized protein LOC104816410 [Tarenaya hassleriana]XP_010543527.1 PREDICTED: uncharacterized protein LOC104816410 [Tarenaya hassleriana]